MSRRNCPGSEVSRLFLDPVPKCLVPRFGAEVRSILRHFGSGAEVSHPNCPGSEVSRLFLYPVPKCTGAEVSRAGLKCLGAEVSCGQRVCMVTELAAGGSESGRLDVDDTEHRHAAVQTSDV